MGDGTKIEWTDATWNPITGCTLVSEGCRHCYAARLAATRLQHHPSRKGLARLNAAGEAKFTGGVRFNKGWLDQPLRWKKPRMIFVCAHGDLFHDGVPDEWIDRIFAVMALAPRHTFQVLTKRPERMRVYILNLQTDTKGSAAVFGGKGRIEAAAERIGWNLKWDADVMRTKAFEAAFDGFPNVWLGTSVEDQATANERIPHLLDTPAAIRFVSAEPLLGPVDLTRLSLGEGGADPAELGPDVTKIELFVDALRGAKSVGWARLDWVIVGGESGPGARPMHPDWARSLRDQCAAAGVAFHFKQWGEWAPTDHLPSDHHAHRASVGDLGAMLHVFDPSAALVRVGKARAGRALDGVEHNGMPANPAPG